MRKEHLGFACAALLSLGACADTRWIKVAVDSETTGNQYHECLTLSRRSQGGVAAIYTPPASQAEFGSRFGTTAPVLAVDAVLREGESTDRCMREQGFTLVPAQATVDAGSRP